MRTCFLCHEAVCPTSLTKCWDSEVRAWAMHDVCNRCRPYAEQIYKQQGAVALGIDWAKPEK